MLMMYILTQSIKLLRQKIRNKEWQEKKKQYPIIHIIEIKEKDGGYVNNVEIQQILFVLNAGFLNQYYQYDTDDEK